MDRTVGSKIVWLISGPLLCLALLAGCFNRPAASGNAPAATVYGAKLGLPTVVVFSALWCHPCREEIESLNKANTEFGSQLQIKGFLVEGEQRGETVQKTDIDRFDSFNGEKPTYENEIDADWKLFDRSRTPRGRSLPTMLLFDRGGQRQKVIQSSLDYETQLRPLLLALIAGEKVPPAETKPTPIPGHQQLNDTVGNWFERREVLARPEFRTNLTAGWEKGLKKLGFPASDMPIEHGRIDFTWDGADTNTPLQVQWNEETPVNVCELRIQLNSDASAAAINGECRPK